MAQPGHPRPNIPPRTAKTNNSSFRKALRSSINTGDLDKSWGKLLLKKAKEAENPATASPSTSSPKDKNKDINKSLTSCIETDAITNISAGEQWLTPNNTIRPRKRQFTSPTTVNNTFQSLPEVDSDPDDAQTSHVTQTFKKPKNNPQQRTNNKNNITNKVKPYMLPSRKTTPSVSFADISKPLRFPQLKGQHNLPDVSTASSHNYNQQFNQPGHYQYNNNNI